jgi:hypothetical protein
MHAYRIGLEIGLDIVIVKGLDKDLDGRLVRGQTQACLCP